MGQRSQIYIRYNVNFMCGKLSPNPRTENYKGLIARYYQWNYGERMISRARYIIERLAKEFMEYKYFFDDESQLEKLKRICDVNFDMKDIVMSSDIIEEWEDEFPDDNFNDYVFKEQGNNDGQLYIDITDDGVKYCFTQYCAASDPMDGEQYMRWNCECENHPNWHMPYQYMDQETIDYTEENIKEINEMATLMTKEELKDFLKTDYSSYALS